jgi:hypothetical protein
VKITIDGTEYAPVLLGEWTYDEADMVKRVTGLTVGQVHLGILQGDALANLAFAVVAYQRQHPGSDPAELREKGIDEIVVDYRDEKAAKTRPPGRGRGGRGSSPPTS